MVGSSNRFRVNYLDAGRGNALLLHSIEEALFWAAHLRQRWSLLVWIDRENATATAW